MGSAKEEGGGAYSGGRGKAVVHRYSFQADGGTCPYDDERDRIQTWRQAVQG